MLEINPRRSPEMTCPSEKRKKITFNRELKKKKDIQNLGFKILLFCQLPL